MFLKVSLLCCIGGCDAVGGEIGLRARTAGKLTVQPGPPGEY